MSEEQPVFKVTDRRLFNADGTPREVARAEKEEGANAGGAKAPETDAPAAEGSRQPASTHESAAATPAAEAAADRGAPREAAREERSESPGRSSAGHPDEDDYSEQDVPGADDPASFINFIMSIASNAAAALGMMEHPVTGQRTVDPELARHWIDVLGMLQQKTRGNLAPQEKQIFDGLLADLRMQYVSLGSPRQPKPTRGLSGRDITGGK